jgi:hypothetical protein
MEPRSDNNNNSNNNNNKNNNKVIRKLISDVTGSLAKVKRMDVRVGNCAGYPLSDWPSPPIENHTSHHRHMN